MKGVVEAGCDEAGRGCLAGPVVAAAVILPKRFNPALVDDSKILKAEQREEAAKLIKKKAVAWAVAVVDHEEIDRINILKASIKAMHIAVDQLKVKPEFLVIDGNYFIPHPEGIPYKCVVDGDALIASIAAASIIAKTHRDALMDKLHLEHPEYGWITNKGYSTPSHKRAINEFGITPYHRRTYAPVSEYMQLEMFGDETVSLEVEDTRVQEEIENRHSSLSD
jgi:ribonuclease HII